MRHFQALQLNPGNADESVPIRMFTTVTTEKRHAGGNRYQSHPPNREERRGERKEHPNVSSQAWARVRCCSVGDRSRWATDSDNHLAHLSQATSSGSAFISPEPAALLAALNSPFFCWLEPNAQIRVWGIKWLISIANRGKITCFHSSKVKEPRRDQKTRDDCNTKRWF